MKKKKKVTLGRSIKKLGRIFREAQQAMATDPDGIIALAAFLSKPDKPRDTSQYQ